MGRDVLRVAARAPSNHQMLIPHLIAVTAGSAAIRLAQPDARYWLSTPVAWTLTGGDHVTSGLTRTVVMPLHGLEAAHNYALAADGFKPIHFTTLSCADIISIADFGATTATSDNSVAIQRAIDALPLGGILYVPPGNWTTGPLFLKSDMELHLAEGATLRARPRDDFWPILPAQRYGVMVGSWEGRPDACHAALITAVNASNIAITGPGVLDGGGADSDWWTWAKGTRNGARRARTVHLINCTNVTLLGPTVQNSPSWTVHPQGCTGVIAAALHIRAPGDSPNTDGLNPESCTDVRIEGVRFSVGDDCIAIKSGKRDLTNNTHLRPTSRIEVRNCLMEKGHGGVVIGSEMSGGVSDVTVRDCEMNGTDRGLRLKTRRGRGGQIARITMQDVTMNGVAVPFCANAFYHCDADGQDDWVQSRAQAQVTDLTPQIDGILIKRTRVNGLRVALGAFLGLPEAPIRNVEIREVVVESYDLDAVPAVPIMADHVREMRHEGICHEFTELTTDNHSLLSRKRLGPGDPKAVA